MNLPRDLGWRTMELEYRSSVAHQFARYALGLDYAMLPQDVVHQAKRSLLDALGCAVGAYEAPGRLICESVAREMGGSEEATVFCSGLRTNILNATLVNSFLVRFLDYNDIGGGGHNSDSMPAILAVSEREKAGGKAFLTSLVISYELGARVIQSFPPMGLEKKGFSIDIRGGLNLPPAVGKIMGLTEEQIANAIGTCASGSITLNIIDADKEENFMRKDTRYGWVAYDAVMSCLLARKGFTGPVRIIEGDAGWRQAIAQGAMDLEKMVDFSGWRILATRHKGLCLNGSTLAHVFATLAIVKEQDLKPEDIASVRIKTCAMDARHTTTFVKKYPRTAENADHSSFYANAFAIKERNFGPDSIKPENFTDPVILDLLEKITVEADPTMPERCFAGKSEIVTKDGRRFEKHIPVAHGFGDDPLSDKELEEKFREMAEKHLGAKQIKQIFDTVWNAEKLTDMGKLARLMVFPAR